jgi:hypothetical protein
VARQLRAAHAGHKSSASPPRPSRQLASRALERAAFTESSCACHASHRSHHTVQIADVDIFAFLPVEECMRGTPL